MNRGTVKWFNNTKGYGFVIHEDSNEELFAHYSTIQMEGYRSLKAGQRVEFDIKPSDKGGHAINIRVIDEHLSKHVNNQPVSVESE